jgi:spoIIIJ-associated protein
MNQESRKIEEVVKKFFQETGLEIEVSVQSSKDSTIPVSLKTDEPQLLIGERGQNLMDIQRLLRMVVNKQITSEQPFFVDLDINDYKKKKVEYLKELARTTADDVSLNKEPKELIPMSAYERRIVHMEVSSRSDVVAESLGEEPNRRIVIKVKS